MRAHRSAACDWIGEVVSLIIPGPDQISGVLVAATTITQAAFIHKQFPRSSFSLCTNWDFLLLSTFHNWQVLACRCHGLWRAVIPKALWSPGVSWQMHLFFVKNSTKQTKGTSEDFWQKKKKKLWFRSSTSLKEVFKEVSVQMFLLSGKCFLTLSSTDSSGQHLDIPLFCSPGPEKRLCEGRHGSNGNLPRVRHHPQGGSQQQRNISILHLDHVDHLHQQILQQICRKETATTQAPEKKTVFMKGQELDLDSEGFCSPLLWAHISYFPPPPSSSCPLPVYSFHHSIIYFTSPVYFPAGGNETKPNIHPFTFYTRYSLLAGRLSQLSLTQLSLGEGRLHPGEATTLLTKPNINFQPFSAPLICDRIFSLGTIEIHVHPKLTVMTWDTMTQPDQARQFPSQGLSLTSCSMTSCVWLELTL